VAVAEAAHKIEGEDVIHILVTAVQMIAIISLKSRKHKY
jgi:hypothetical protein